MAVFLLPFSAFGQIECDGNEHVLEIVARDPDGDFIPGANIKIFKQIYDADGQPKPGIEVASGKTNSLTGIFKKTFGSSVYDNYVVKVWINNSAEGAFWYYDVYVGCNSLTQFTANLSAIHVVIRDSQDNLLKNRQFKLWTQKYDVDNDPIKEKQDLVGTFDTSNEGEATVYIPSSGRAIDQSGPEYYIFEMSGPMGGTYIDNNISISDASTREYNYKLSDVEIYLKDSNNVAFPSGNRLSFYHQEEDDDSNRVLGAKIKELSTDDDGRIIWQYPTGVYAAKIAGADSQEQIFWDIEIFDESRETYFLKTQSGWLPASGACEAESSLTVVTNGLDGFKINGLKFVLFEEDRDVNGNKMPGKKLVNGVIEELGKKTVQINPDPRKRYILKIFDKNADTGAFWYYDGFQFNCGENVQIEKHLPAFRAILRDGGGGLVKNHKFSVWTQKHDADGQPIKEKQDLVADGLNTSNEGEYVLYLGPDSQDHEGQNGVYIFQTQKNNAVFTEYDIEINPQEDYLFEYKFSDLLATVKDASGKYLNDKQVKIFFQDRDAAGNRVLGKEAAGGRTDSGGLVHFEYPAGYYALSLKDSLGQNNVFWNTRISNRTRAEKEFRINLSRVSVLEASGAPKKKGTSFSVFDMVKDENGYYYKNEKKKTFELEENGSLEISLAPGPYLFLHTHQKQQYGQAMWAENGKVQELAIRIQPDHEIKTGQSFRLSAPSGQDGLSERLKGYILLQVEERGEAWYVNHQTRRRYYLENGTVAYSVMRNFGLGIKNSDLNRIPIGLDSRFEAFDYDGDAVFDKMEEALGTDMFNHDTDGDGYDDGTEILNGYDPQGSGRADIDQALTGRLLGRILLQVEERGEAWYVNPRDGRRYYMPDGEAAYEIMRFLSLGITNENLEQIEEGFVPGV